METESKVFWLLLGGSWILCSLKWGTSDGTFFWILGLTLCWFGIGFSAYSLRYYKDPTWSQVLIDFIKNVLGFLAGLVMLAVIFWVFHHVEKVLGTLLTFILAIWVWFTITE